MESECVRKERGNLKWVQANETSPCEGVCVGVVVGVRSEGLGIVQLQSIKTTRPLFSGQSTEGKEKVASGDRVSGKQWKQGNK